MSQSVSDTRPAPRRHVAPLHGVRLVYGVVLHQLFSKGRLLALGALALIAPLAGFALGSSDNASLEDGVRLIASLGFAVVIPIVALVFGTASIGDLRDDKTLVYVVVDHGFNIGEFGHRYAPYVFLGTNDKSVKRNGTREDIAPTVLKRFGVDLTKIEPKLDGIPLDESAPERKAPAENPNPRPGAAKRTLSRG